jgi:hypothetical protein
MRHPKEDEMSTVRIAGIVLMLAGAFGLLYGTFSYTKESHKAQLGALELTVKDRETVNIPVWAGVGALVAGGLMLVVPKRKS